MVSLVGLALGSCADETGPLPLPRGARRFTPDAVYRAWWHEMELCADRSGDFAAVSWYLYPGETPFRVPGHANPVLGYWDPADNRIVLLEFLPERRAPYIRHEALHAILRRIDHPAEYFQRRCGAVIDGPETPFGTE